VQEAPQLQQLAAIGVPIWGIAYKDKPDAATQFLQRNGDPYARLDQDVPGLTAINFGVYGVPETYFVDRTGVVRWRWAGPLTPDIVQQQLEPLLRKYQ
jgi:cytochrome c biogenesis protein CcmG/thiol:disulfide interchange protein DsbE